MHVIKDGVEREQRQVAFDRADAAKLQADVESQQVYAVAHTLALLPASPTGSFLASVCTLFVLETQLMSSAFAWCDKHLLPSLAFAALWLLFGGNRYWRVKLEELDRVRSQATGGTARPSEVDSKLKAMLSSALHDCDTRLGQKVRAGGIVVVV